MDGKANIWHVFTFTTILIPIYIIHEKTIQCFFTCAFCGKYSHGAAISPATGTGRWPRCRNIAAASCRSKKRSKTLRRSYYAKGQNFGRAVYSAQNRGQTLF